MVLFEMRDVMYIVQVNELNFNSTMRVMFNFSKLVMSNLICSCFGATILVQMTLLYINLNHKQNDLHLLKKKQEKG